jgi:ElaB/YqjD/DUF883 family membrane-anchored ribosome-binding protein
MATTPSRTSGAREREAAGKAEEVTAKVQEAVQEKAGEAKGAVSRAVSQRVETTSSQAASQLHDVSSAFRQSSGELREQGKEQPAKVVEAVSDRTDQLARYLSESSSSQILDDLERLGRARPWLAIAGGLAVGFLGARLLKASSQRRFEDYRLQYQAGHPLRAAQSTVGITPRRPAAPAGSVDDGVSY